MFFYTFMPKIFNMSLTASVAIVLVILLRLLLKKAPKVISYALWGVVLFRLLCPVSISSDFSVYNLFDTPAQESGTITSVIEYVPSDIVHAEYPTVALPVPGVNDVINEVLPQGQEQLVADPLEAPMSFVTYAWMIGVLGMAIYSIVSYVQLRRKLSVVVPLRDNIFIADDIKSPFVVGLFRPKIYLPCNLGDQEQEYIILHEQHHIKRLDHVMKALAFFALAIHWFNPLVWVAFILASKDMEMSCDEAVIRKVDGDVRADYSASLLTLATGRRIIAGTPLAFGEGDTTGRIRNLANWRKPAFLVVLVAVVACIALAVGLMTNPADDDISDPANDSYFLLIGADGVESIEITGPNTSGGAVNADGSVFKKGEKVWLEQLQGVTDLRGYSITALGKNGEILYALSIPEEATNDEVINLVGSDGWLLAPTDYVSSLSGIPGKAFVYEDEGILGSFTITLYEDKTFTYYEGMASSYIGVGYWEQDGDTITLTDDVNGGYGLVNHFKLDGETLIFVENGSDNFVYVKVEDGEKFNCTGEAFKQIQAADVPTDDDAPALKYYLTIGADGVKSIKLSMSHSSGGFESADGSSLKKGERIWLESLDGYSDLRGLTITALDKYGEVIWTASIPNSDENKGFTHLTQDGWTITNSPSESVAVSRPSLDTEPYSAKGVSGINVKELSRISGEFECQDGVSFVNLAPGEEVISSSAIHFEENSSVMLFITWGAQDLFLEFGIRAEDGTEFFQEKQGGSSVLLIEDIPAGTYYLYVKNSDAYDGIPAHEKPDAFDGVSFDATGAMNYIINPA